MPFLRSFAFALFTISCFSRITDSNCPDSDKQFDFVFSVPDNRSLMSVRSGYTFDKIWLTTIQFKNKNTLVTIKSHKLESMSDSLILPNDNLGSYYAEWEFLACVKHAGTIYIVKSAFRREDICPNGELTGVREEPNNPKKLFVYNQKREIWGNFKAIPRFFDSLPTLGKGGFGLVKEVEVEGEVLALKRGKSSGVPVGELLLTQMFSTSKYGVLFRGCFTLGKDDDQIQYMALGKLPHKTDRSDFINNFRKSSLEARLLFYMKLMGMIASFEKLGFSHNDIKPDNIMADEKGEPHLLDYGCARPIGGFDGGCGTRLYTSMRRIQQQRSLPYNDVFSMAITILAFEHPSGEDFVYMGVNNKQVDTNNWPPAPNQVDVFRNHWTTKINGALSKVWGPYIAGQKKVSMNFTTLMMTIIVDEADISAREAIEVISFIMQRIVAENDSNSYNKKDLVI